MGEGGQRVILREKGYRERREREREREGKEKGKVKKKLTHNLYEKNEDRVTFLEFHQLHKDPNKHHTEEHLQVTL